MSYVVEDSTRGSTSSSIFDQSSFDGELEQETMVAIFMATCDFVSSLDYDKWTTSAKLTLIIVMLIGACIGSTGGGIKVGRLLVDLKYTYRELAHMIHPHMLMTVRLWEQTVTKEVLRPILLYSFTLSFIWPPSSPYPWLWLWLSSKIPK